MLFAEVQQPSISLFFIEFDVRCQFSKANRAELKRSSIIFVNVHKSIHEALIVYTVSDAKHMAYLVDHDP